MLKKSISIVILTIFTCLTISCYKQNIVNVNQIKKKSGKVLAVVTTEGDWIELPNPGTITDNEIVYQTVENGQKKLATISLLEVKRVWLKKFSTKYLWESLIVLPVSVYLTWMLVRNLTR